MFHLVEIIELLLILRMSRRAEWTPKLSVLFGTAYWKQRKMDKRLFLHLTGEWNPTKVQNLHILWFSDTSEMNISHLYLNMLLF